MHPVEISSRILVAGRVNTIFPNGGLTFEYCGTGIFYFAIGNMGIEKDLGIGARPHSGKECPTPTSQGSIPHPYLQHGQGAPPSTDSS